LKTSNLPTSETYPKTSNLKVGINICGTWWYVYMFYIVTVVCEEKCLISNGPEAVWLQNIFTHLSMFNVILF